MWLETTAGLVWFGVSLFVAGVCASYGLFTLRCGAVTWSRWGFPAAAALLATAVVAGISTISAAIFLAGLHH